MKKQEAKLSSKLPWKYKGLIIGLLVAIIYYWALTGTQTSPTSFVKGIPFMIDFVKRMFPPDITHLSQFLQKAVETLQMAIVGSSIGAIIALPLSFLAARNIMPNKYVYHLIRTIFDALRGINEIIWGLIFVSMVGLGPFPGVLALSAHVTGALGRYFSEAIETVDQEVIKAIVSTGANKIQVISRGILPQVKPLFINYILYYLENNFRAATVLGLVGAGGVGRIIETQRIFLRFDRISPIIVFILAIVILIEQVSVYVRRKVL